MSTKPFPCLLCPKTYLTRKSLLAHETKKHPHNHVVPHSLGFELPSSWCLCQFQSVFFVNVSPVFILTEHPKISSNSLYIAPKTFFIMFFTKSQVSNINQLSGNISVYIREEMGIKELAISLRIPIGAKKKPKWEVRSR